jgi:predicted nucleic acid-binding protein
MATLIDASVVIAAERGRLDLDRLLVEHAEQSVALAAITASELLHAVHRAATAAASVNVVEHDRIARIAAWLLGASARKRILLQHDVDRM